mmetsp:Transcript_2291/g.8887  ORF Transcript_2291/g.8887 Transcript_2291/m.8887 type:complete len:226 (-) Transcript_2291:474-1151(-)
MTTRKTRTRRHRKTTRSGRTAQTRSGRPKPGRGGTLWACPRTRRRLRRPWVTGTREPQRCSISTTLWKTVPGALPTRPTPVTRRWSPAPRRWEAGWTRRSCRASAAHKRRATTPPRPASRTEAARLRLRALLRRATGPPPPPRKWPRTASPHPARAASFTSPSRQARRAAWGRRSASARPQTATASAGAGAGRRRRRHPTWEKATPSAREERLRSGRRRLFPTWQ